MKGKNFLQKMEKNLLGTSLNIIKVLKVLLENHTKKKKKEKKIKFFFSNISQNGYLLTYNKNQLNSFVVC